MPLEAPLSSADEPLLRLLEQLDAQGYDFVTATPATHARVLRRPGKALARDVRDVLGWSLPFRREHIPAQLIELLDAAGVLAQEGELLKSEVRVSRVRGLLFLHSAYPTDEEDAVFLGPDSYRFASFIAAELAGRSWVGRLVDVGGGAGVGALTAAAGRGGVQVLITDVNAKALRLARINAYHARLRVETRETAGLEDVPEGADLILANPPYMVDGKARAYRDGGDMHGAALSLEWAKTAYAKLAPGGRFLLYTGSAIVDGGQDELRQALNVFTEEIGARLSYRELDPDVFGEELDKPPYQDVERIAVVGAVITKPRRTPPEN
ncbi:methyltransferase [Phenylobacterium deserti]|uniref:Methyltransferase n=1 Tax=Phenylobacterium deserti TaxID=1914756 RepID=A0A328A850_9CAUL|nr:methyltransferase [Phenylobacterium deserti]RAK50722.1 methyltransferase [Phenylobacterium deserti]